MAASKPASKPPAKPASKAAAKPASKSAPASKATAPISKARPSSSRARPSTSAPAPAPAQDQDIEMKDESATTTTTKANGDAKPVSKSSVPAKRGRVGAIVDAEKKNRRRSSLGGGITLPVPQIPGTTSLRLITWCSWADGRCCSTSKSGLHVWKWRHGTTRFRA